MKWQGSMARCLFARAFTSFAVIYASSTSWADVHLVVGTPEQGGQYATVQAAVDAVPAENTERYVINIKPGTYVERVKIPTTKPFITLRGEDPLTTKLTYNQPANALPNDNRNWASTVVEGKDFIAENLAFENSYGTGVQALALYAKADRLIFNNCRFLGNQDTLRSESGRHYFYNSYVEGTVDFIYGKGTAYFENSTLFAKSNGYLTAHGREQSTETTGYVFKNATITGSAANGSVYLGRPWAAYARVVFIDSKIGPVINPAGWATWSGNNHLTADFHEYNSMDLNGDPLDVSQRVSWSEQLTADQLAPFSKANWLAGSDGWNPVIEDVVAGQLGDYNGDGVVDALDYTVWRNHLGETDETNLNNNGDGGDVSPADYDLWKAHYGETNSGAGAGGLASVPEPGALGVLFALVGCVARSRFRPTR
jgi:pectin methylesterase-like acyl-CoA thioesterase